MAMTPTHDTNTNKDQPTSTPTPERAPLATKPAHTPAKRNRRHRNAVRVFPGSVRLPGRAIGGHFTSGYLFLCCLHRQDFRVLLHPVATEDNGLYGISPLRTSFRACFGAWHSRDMQSLCCLSRFDAITTTRSAAHGPCKAHSELVSFYHKEFFCADTALPWN